MEHGVRMEQPERIYRFRYASEKGTHGALSGNIKDQPPKFFWDIPHAYAGCEFMVLVSLYEENSIDNAPLKLSPHTLWEESANGPNDEMLYKPYFKPMERKENTGHLILKYCYISNVKNKNIVAALREKYQKLRKANFLTGKDANAEQQKEQVMQYEKHNKKNNSGGHQSVQLGYTIFTKSGLYICGPFLSEPIVNADPIKINRICPATGSFDGDDVVLLVNKISHPKSVQIRVFEVVNDETEHSKIITNEKLEFHGNQAICTKMPEWLSRDTDVQCFVEIKYFGLQSDRATYVYRNTNLKRKLSESPITYSPQSLQSPQTDDHSPPKQLLTADSVRYYCNIESSTDSEKQSSVAQMVKDIKKITEQKSLDIEEKLDKIRKLMRTLRFENGNTLFHAALEEGLFLKLYICISRNFDVLLRESISDYNQNLLHYACEIDQYDHIRALIGRGCAIYASDYSRNTPLHIAIERKHRNCVRKFAEIIEDPGAYPEQLQADIKELLSVYNQKGLTVLHMAVIHDLRDLVKAILVFCQTQDLDACTMQVLGNGDTIMHLAVTRKLKDMAKLIVKQIPDAMYYRNYAMVTTADSYKELLCDISELRIESNVSK